MTELDALLEQVGKRRYLFHAFRVDQHGPDVLAAVHSWGELADVLILFDENVACAYRTPTGSRVDVFNPERVFWWYGTNPVHTLRALLTLAPPGHPNAPVTLAAPPRGFAIPREIRTPVNVRRRGH